MVRTAKGIDGVQGRTIKSCAVLQVGFGRLTEMSAYVAPSALKKQIVKPSTDPWMLGVNEHRLPQLARLVWDLGERGRHGPTAFECRHRSKSLAVPAFARVESEGVGEALAIGVVTPAADDGIDDLVLSRLFCRGDVGPLHELQHPAVIASVDHHAMFPSWQRNADPFRRHPQRARPSGQTPTRAPRTCPAQVPVVLMP